MRALKVSPPDSGEAATGDSPEGDAGLIEAALSDPDLSRWIDELMDPGSWQDILSKYGRTMNLAVALTDVHGKLLGSCQNARPVWTMARKGGAEPSLVPRNGCAFCLVSDPPCKAVSEALATRKAVYTTDLAGLTHVAIPLVLGNQRLGAVIAGQSFSQHPQPLNLRRIAKHYGASEQELWHAAVHQIPVSRPTLQVYADLLASLGHAFLRERYAAILDRELHRTNQRYRLMIEGSRDRALFTVDGVGRVTSWNPGAEHLLGYTEAEIKGRDYATLFTREDIRAGLPERELREVEQRGWIEEETWQVRKDGTRFLSETVTARLGEGDAREYGRLLHDVTRERKSVEASLQAQKLESIGILAGGIAHDFNNLLTSILGNVSLAMWGLPAGDQARPLLGHAEMACMKAATLIAQLLSYAGKGRVTVKQFELSQLITELLPILGGSIPATVHLEAHLTPDMWIIADSGEIQQIITNLVTNAAESTEPGPGTVTVATGPAALIASDGSRQGGVYLEVRDTGCGMDEASLDKIFDPFFTTKFAGRGLGLAVVSGIVRRLKGSLDVRSVPDKGSVFRIVFPAAPAPMPAPISNRPKENRQGTGLVLVVDDEAMVRNLASAVLERYGYRVVTAANGDEAVDMFRRHADTIRAVLLDLTMPQMGGGEAFRLMTEIRPDIPILISSGYSESSVREQFASALAGVIKKPYTVSELREKIGAILTLKMTPRN